MKAWPFLIAVTGTLLCVRLLALPVTFDQVQGLGSAATNNASAFDPAGASTNITLGGAASGLPGAVSIINSMTFSSGSAYTLTTTPAQCTFGTTTASFTLPSNGTYLLLSNVQTTYVAATYVGLQSVTYKFRKTSGTAADVANGSGSSPLGVISLFSSTGPQTTLMATYTGSAGDTIQVWGSVSAAPSAGSVTCSSSGILALKITP